MPPHRRGQYRDPGTPSSPAGVDLAWIAGAKQFNQSYWWSFDYVKWRSGTPSTPPPPTTPPPPAVDSKAPSIAITAPAAGATIAGQVAVAVSASDDKGVTALKYYVDNAPVAVFAPPTGKYTWDTTASANGAHTLQVVALDAAGNTSQGVGVRHRGQLRGHHDQHHRAGRSPTTRARSSASA